MRLELSRVVGEQNGFASGPDSEAGGDERAYAPRRHQCSQRDKK